ncbi:Histone deacetylase 8 [Phytophthora pseudosyringae]|uniref:Histone deacetylase 8 n=1 Tax=Phytophthora pseudosyringae TaxID=221518 RepID=A0A8T1WGN9_9STRA|nr:Histone deacetylase 8 [Phytophthora pseudosyringae]
MLSVSALKLDHPLCHALAVTSLLLLPVALQLTRRSSSSSTESDATGARTQSEPERREAARPLWTLPVLHNTLQLLLLWLAGGDLHDWITKNCERFEGRPFAVKVLGLPEMLVVATPQAFEDVLQHRFLNFPKGPHLQENMKDLLGDGILAVDGLKWAHQRDVARGLFRTQELRECLTETVTRHTVALHDVLKTVSARNRSVDLYKLLSCFSTEAFTDVSFGVTMNCLRANKELPFQAAFDRAQRLTAQRFVRPRWFWKLQKRMGLGAEDQLQLDVKEIDAAVLSIVQQVLANRTLSAADGQSKNRSMLSLFLDTIATSPATEQQLDDPVYLRDVVVNFLVAGRDTTAQALSWFFYSVSQNPRVEAKLRRELAKKLPELTTSECCVPTLQQVNRLVYLEAVIKETLRLYPSTPISPKYAVRDTVLSDGTFVPAGTTVCLPLYAMGRMTHVWGPDAAVFNPERWIDPASKRIVSVSAFKFVAFNAGPRMCLGASLAGLELKLVAAALLSRFHIHVEKPEAVGYEFSLTLPVKGPMNVRLARVSAGFA